MKTLADFKQEVAEKYGCKEWGLLRYGTSTKRGEELLEEAAELYAAYRSQDAREEGYAEGFGKVMEAGISTSDAYKQRLTEAWNAALDVAAESAEVSNDPYGSKIWVNKDSILRLKK